MNEPNRGHDHSPVPGQTCRGIAMVRKADGTMKPVAVVIDADEQQKERLNERLAMGERK